MSHLKNYRGATNYFFPATDKYRDGYDRVFGKKEKEELPEAGDKACPAGGHDYTTDGGGLRTACRYCGRPLTMDAR